MTVSLWLQSNILITFEISHKNGIVSKKWYIFVEFALEPFPNKHEARV